MAHILYDNIVLENTINDILETKLNAQNLMTIDNDLQSEAGMVKRINAYQFEGAVEELAKGAKNTEKGKVTFAGKDYRVTVKQQTFEYHDEDAMQDPLVVQVGINGAATEMINHMNDEYFREVAKTSTVMEVNGTFNYDAVVDAIEKMNVVENEEGLFLLIGNDLKAQIRKDEDFKSARMGEILFSGQIGSIAGVPVVLSKRVPNSTAYLATKEAVKCFTKKASQVEQSRDIETRTNTVVLRKVNLVALVDETKVVKITVAKARAAK